MTVLPMGERALLVEVEGLDEVLALHAALQASRPDGVVELVPAARTVLVRVDPARFSLRAAASWLSSSATSSGARPDKRADEADAGAPDGGDPPLELDVAYDGEDLAQTAGMLGLSVDGLVRRHSDAVWRVAFGGFAPGFGYLTSREWDVDVPRLDAPRTRVPAGAIGLAAAFTGAYPRSSPGGWRLIGHTGAPLFDPAAADPVLLVPGRAVRFRPVRPALASSSARAREPAPALTSRPRPPGTNGVARGFEVEDPGARALVQDDGRPGRAHLGIAVSGALDRDALAVANRLVGNPAGAATVEILLGGFRARASTDLWVALAGAWGPLTLDGAAVAPYQCLHWRRGAMLEIGRFAAGVRGVLAVRGGIDVPAEVGSRATDTLAGLGPDPLRAGTLVGVGADPDDPVPPLDLAPWSPPPRTVEVELAQGPRAHWLADPAALFDREWRVDAASDRVGMRLAGEPLARRVARELPSEGTVPGAIQVPPGGQPTILLADGPVTGGYPVVAVVTDGTLDRLAQAAPGTVVRFRRAIG